MYELQLIISHVFLEVMFSRPKRLLIIFLIIRQKLTLAIVKKSLYNINGLTKIQILFHVSPFRLVSS
jgi:hypothetical protein